MNLLLFGSNYFKAALILAGHNPLWAGSDEACDIRSPENELDVGRILNQMDFRPDAIIITDDLGRRSFPSGLEKTNILKIWYAVDSPLNFFWQKEYACLFDLVFVDQKNEAIILSAYTKASVVWLPVGIETDLYKGDVETKEYDAAFVGTVNSHVRPKRSLILDQISKQFSLVTGGGRQDEWLAPQKAAQLYRKARLVLNENLFDGVTTRMLEGMASGSMLITEDSANGLDDLFEAGHDLAVFGPDNMIDRMEYYIKNNDTREQIASRGREKVFENHSVFHRAQTLIGLIAKISPVTGLTEGGEFFRQMGKVLFLSTLRWDNRNRQVNLNRALTMLNRANRTGNLDPDALYYKGMIHFFHEDQPKALEFLRESFSMNHLGAAVALGLIHMAENRDIQSLNCFSKAFAMLKTGGDETFTRFKKDKGSSRMTANMHYCLGCLLDSLGHGLTPGFAKGRLALPLWDGLDHYYRAIELDPDHGEANACLGNLLFDHKAYTQSAAYLNRAVELKVATEGLPEKAETAMRLGYLTNGP